MRRCPENGKYRLFYYDLVNSGSSYPHHKYAFYRRVQNFVIGSIVCFGLASETESSARRRQFGYSRLRPYNPVLKRLTGLHQHLNKRIHSSTEIFERPKGHEWCVNQGNVNGARLINAPT